MIGYLILGAAFLVLLVIIINTLRCKKPNEKAVEKITYHIDDEKICERLSDAIKIKTITNKNPDALDSDAFLRFHRYLENNYPLLHKTLTKEVVSDYSLL